MYSCKFLFIRSYVVIFKFGLNSGSVKWDLEDYFKGKVIGVVIMFCYLDVVNNVFLFSSIFKLFFDNFGIVSSCYFLCELFGYK